MPIHWLLCSAVLLALPLVFAYFAAPRTNDSFARALFRVPVAFAGDILFVSILTVFIPLSIATIASRVVYVLAFLAWRFVVGRFRREHQFGALASGLVAGIVTVVGFLELSWHFVIWDRGWHMPLVASLEGQTLPFHNALDGGLLSYHLGGDLVGAMARACSFDHLSSLSALSLVHDLALALTVAWLIALCRALGARSLAIPAVLATALAFHGPIPNTIGVTHEDVPFFPFTQLSYRPHAPLSLLAGTMLVSAFVSRIVAPRIRGAHAAIAASVVIASICDEASVGIYGLAMGITWLFFPRVFGQTRLRGIAFLVLLAFAVVLPNVLITRTIGSGGVVRGVKWVLPRFAGVEGGETPLFSFGALLHGPMWLAAPITATVAIAVSRFVKRPLVLFVFATVLVAIVPALCLVVNGSPGEAQRFYIALFVVPIVVATLTIRHAPTVMQSLAVLNVVTPAILSVYSDWTISWGLRGGLNASGAHNPDMPFSIFDVDCAEVLPKLRFGERPRRMYIDHAGHSLYSACRSLIVPGRVQAGWGISIFEDSSVTRQKETLEKNITGKTAPAACWSTYASDSVCQDLKNRKLCKPGNTYFVDCTLPLHD
jgi:hypothetical protein